METSLRNADQRRTDSGSGVQESMRYFSVQVDERNSDDSHCICCQGEAVFAEVGVAVRVHVSVHPLGLPERGERRRCKPLAATFVLQGEGAFHGV